MAQTRFYMDVTQLAHWQGNMTGIPRVMHEFAVRFRQAYPEARFVIWTKEPQALCEIDLDKTLAQRGKGIAYLHAGEEVSAAPTPGSRLPKRPLRRLAVKAAKAGVVQMARINPQLAEKVERRLRQQRASNYKQADFHKGDSILIPWGEWWDPNFTERIMRYHKHDGVRLVQIIHDVGPTVAPQFFEQVDISPTAYNSEVLPAADLVLANSKHTERELKMWLTQNKLHVPPIRVFRLGDDIHISRPVKPDDPVFIQSKLKGNDYILFVGTIEIKKNHLLLYYVYKLAKARGITLPKLVMAGRRGWMTEATFALMTQDPDVKDSFVFLLDKSDEELSWLYSHCLFTVLPSLYEGWGIPIAESVARGVPCLCGDTSSLNEVAEGYVAHFSSVSTDECLSGIQRWLDPATLKKARERARTYKPYSWDDSFNQVNAYLKEIFK